MALVASLAAAQSASLSVAASLNGGNPHVAGTTSTYTITVSNEGPDNALNVNLSTAVPTGTTFQSITFPGAWSCATPAIGGTGSITCSTATFAPGSDVFTLVVNVPRATAQGTLITLDANVTTTTTDPNPNDNIVALTAPVIWQSSLGLGKSGPASAFAGAPITYTLNVTNGGPSDAADVVLNDTLPADVLFDSVTAPGWTCSTPAIGSSGTVSCTIAQFGTSGTVTIQGHTAPSTPPETLTNNAAVSASSEPNTHTASANTTLTQSADIGLTKSSSALAADIDVTYTIVVNNSGPSDASNVALTDPLPAGLTFQSLSAPGWSCIAPAVGSGGTVSCSRATLAPASSTITIVAHIPASTPTGTIISNTVTTTASTFDPTTPNSATSSGATAAIPALSQFALIALALVVAALAVRRL